MKASVRITLIGALASALMVLSPYSTRPAHAIMAVNEIVLNSSNVQVVHNTLANTDVLNMSLNVTNRGDFGTGDCNSGLNDPLESLFIVGVSRFSCATFISSCMVIGVTCPDFLAGLIYVEHDIGSASYGTSFLPNAAGFVASKIVALATPPNTCGTWNINLQATGQNLSLITGPKVSLLLGDADADGGSFLSEACFDVNVNVGTGIVKPHHGVHSLRH
jgi:hypothetical protein